MSHQNNETTPDILAYRMLGQHLLHTIKRNHPQRLEALDPMRVELHLERIMDDFCAADTNGSVCINLKDLFKSAQEANEILPLFENLGLLTKAPLKLTSTPHSHSPFIWDSHSTNQRLYLQRRFCEEREVALALAKYLQLQVHSISPHQETLIQAFRKMRYENGQTSDTESVLEQENAIRGALSNSFFVITGGPGTGKTTVVAKLIECLLSNQSDLTIGLAAPTGKAASRVMQSIQDSCSRAGSMFQQLKKQVTEQKIVSQTIHKWLTTNIGNTKPSLENPLPIDVLIIDEASMIDLTLAKRLLRCINTSKTRLILLGDKHQLAAVGPGSVLADLTDTKGVLKNHVAELTVSHRFTSDSNIGTLARAINNGAGFDIHNFRKLFERHGKDTIAWFEPQREESLQKETQHWIRHQLSHYTDALKDYLNALLQPNIFNDDTSKITLLMPVWNAADEFRILCAQRQGFNSVAAVNRFADEIVRNAVNQWAIQAIEDHAIDENLISLPFNDRFYPGRLIINRVNYTPLDIFNGDVGIVIPTREDLTHYEVFFGDRQELKPAVLLPEHDTAFALTIHQSQGSQFERVAVLLPMDESSSLTTRELLYTGITRAKKEVILFASSSTMKRACLTKTERASGLGDRLKEL